MGLTVSDYVAGGPQSFAHTFTTVGSTNSYTQGTRPPQEQSAPPGIYDPAAPLEEQLQQHGRLLSIILDHVQCIHAKVAGASKDYFTVEEVGELVGRRPYTIRRWIKQGKLVATRVKAGGPRGRLLIARQEVKRLTQEGQAPNVAALTVLSNDGQCIEAATCGHGDQHGEQDDGGID